MKKLVLFLLVCLSFSACNKDKDEVKPQTLASEVAGTYKLTSFRYQDQDNDYQMPQLPVVQRGKETDFGTVTLSEQEDPNHVKMGLSLTLPSIGLEGEEEDFLEAEVRKNGSKYDLYSNGTKLASVNGNTLSLDIKSSGERMAFSAQR